jgi:hypothetical protein
MDSNGRVSVFEAAPPFVIGQDAAAIRAGKNRWSVVAGQNPGESDKAALFSFVSIRDYYPRPAFTATEAGARLN